MTTTIDGLHLRRTFGRKHWRAPEPFGPDGWRMVNNEGTASIIVTCWDVDGAEWVHASIAHAAQMPTYDELVLLYEAVWRKAGYAYQMFVPGTSHVNIHQYALHLWGRLDGAALMPDFGALLGTI